VSEKEKEWSVIACLAEARHEGLSTSMLCNEGESEVNECEVGLAGDKLARRGKQMFSAQNETSE